MKEGGVKFDGEKLRYDLIPWQALEEAAKVLTHGAKKYAPGNWKKVPDAKNRYYAALMRHLQEVRKGNLIDDDSGYSHLAHVLCNAMFLVYLYVTKAIDTKKPPIKGAIEREGEDALPPPQQDCKQRSNSWSC